MTSFRGSRWIFCAFSALLLPRLVAAQVKWTVPDLQELGGDDRISTGKTPLSAEEKAALTRITGRAIHKCLSDPVPGKSRHFLDSFNDLRIKGVQLDNTGLRGLVVQASGDCMCGGVGNCDFWLIAERPSGLNVVLQTFAIQSFEIERATSNGYFDVILGNHNSASETDLSLYHYTGTYYRRTACALMSYQGDHFQALKVPTIAPESCRGR